MPDPVLNAAIDAACEAIASGGVAIFPTDTFFALGANALDAAAVATIFELKGRNERQPLPVLIPSSESVRELSSTIPSVVCELAEKFWPGPLTIVIEKSDAVPATVTGGGETVGVRVPDHPVALEILRRVGKPVTGTSANPSGTPPTKDVSEIKKWFGNKEVAIVEAPCGAHSVPSTVLDLTKSPPIIVRSGGVPIEALRPLLPDVTVSPPH